MKKKLIFLLFAFVAIFAASANPVDVNRARKVGAGYLAAVGHQIVGELEAVKTPFNEFYIFNGSDGGFVLVAADDCVRPILGYSLTGTFRVDQMPTNVQGWLEDYENGIIAVKQAMKEAEQGPRHSNSAQKAIAEEWRMYANGTAPQAPLSTSVSPLLTTTWNQSPLYNDMCPYDSIYGQRVVTGCVATATAQIMKYWNHPAQGYGSHSYTPSNSHISYGVQSANFGATNYAWNNMPNALTSVSSQTEIDAVAQLMYHVGVAIEMNYNVSSEGGSGAYNHSDYYPSSMSALVDYFKYAPDIALLRRSGCDDATFSAALRAELDQTRPILFDGRDNSGGHSFVCDGYDQNNFFHFNWGWGGYCDGYYMIGALNPTPGGTGGNSTYTFNISNTALLGIRPNPSFGNGGTVTVNTTGGNASCSVTGGGTYGFGDTVTLVPTAGEGYRFAGWSDNSKTNPRSFTMTGGNYSLTARFETLGSDTMSYCGNLGHNSYWGEYQQGADKYWGIKLPASSLTPGRTLTAVEFYVGNYYYDGYYDVTVYSGTTSPTDTVYSTSVWVSYDDQNDWFSLFLPSAYTVEANKSLWLTFHNNDILFPATISSSCGNPDGFLYGPQFTPDPAWNQFTFMIRGRFDNPGIIADGDTISYCGNKPLVQNWSPNEWGIMIPASDLAGRNYLKSVKLYANDYGVYTLRVYRGGTTAPGTLVHTQPADITTYGWNEIMLDNTVTLNTTDNVWITLSCPGAAWPASSCRYTGCPNSNWLSWGNNEWEHAAYSWGSFSWLIKAVTSATAPSLPPPTVAISGDQYLGIGTAATFTAIHTTGTTVTWDIQGITPSTATGDAVTVTWNQASWYRLIASVSNSHGTGADTMWVNVVDCGQAITVYPYRLGFETTDNMVCVGTLDADNDGQGWELSYNGYTGQRAFYSTGRIWNGNDYVQTAANNWFFLPKMTTRQGSGYSYSMTWYEMASADEVNNPHYGVYIDTTCSTNPSNYVLLAEYTMNAGYWYQLRTLDLSAYTGKTFRLAFRHFNSSTNELYIDDITINENIPFFREGDTISYCGFRGFENNLGYSSGNTYWGVKFPSSRLANCDTLKSVLVYVISNGDYTLNIWQGGDNAPGTLQRTVSTTFNNQYGWQEITLTPAMVVDATQPLWVTFYSTAPYPAAYAQYSGDANSDWISGDGSAWAHALDYDFYSSWMIKAVTAATAGCGGITLPYQADFTQCWTATSGASIIDNNHASFNSYGQKLTSPWFEAPVGKCYMHYTTIRDYGSYWYNWDDSAVSYRVTVESESGVVDYWGAYSYESNCPYRSSFYSNGGRYRLIFEYDNPQPIHQLHLSNLVVYHYPLSVTISGPTSVHIGDTVTYLAQISLPNGDTIDDVSWNMYCNYQWVGDNDSNITIVSSTNNSRTIVFHSVSECEINVDVYKNGVFQNYGADAHSWLGISVLDTVTIDCDNISLPFTADFTQCWTAEGGATIIDYDHASITQSGQRLVSPWMQSVPGKVFLRHATTREGSCDYNNEQYMITVEGENGVISSWWHYAENIYWSRNNTFTSPGGRIRVIFEYTGNNPVPSFQINKVILYQYQIDVTLDVPGIVRVGDTVTFTAHATLQNGDTPDYCDWSMYDQDGDWMDDYNPARTILSQSDSTIVMVWNTAGRYEVYLNVEKYGVYQSYSAYVNTYGYINVVDNSFYAEDSIYYTSAAKDTVIGCHSQLHMANLPASVRVIRDSAFYNLANLFEVNMPNGLARIGNMAFAYNHQLYEVTIPRGVRFIGDYAFLNCSNLAMVNFNAVACTVMGPTNGNYICPVFSSCDNLHTINFGEEVTYIPPHGFAHCYGLRGTIVIPDAVTTIGRSAFYQTINTWNEGDTIHVMLGRSVSEIGDWAFYQHYNKLRSVVTRNPVPPAIYSSTFWLNPEVTTLTVPCGTTEAYHNAYYWYEFELVYEDCTGIEAVDDDDVRIYTLSEGIVIEGAQGESIEVYDVMGRMVATAVNNNTLIRIPQTGVYMVRIGERSARKVVMLR